MKSAKYIVMIDYAKVPKLEYRLTEAKTLPEAMTAADAMKAESIEPIYLMKIMERTGNAMKIDGGTEYTYIPVLCRRSNGWHVNDQANSETMYPVNIWYWRNTWCALHR